MTDKEKIRKEVERLMNELIQEKEKGFDFDINDACILELQNVLTFIDSLQEEPVAPKVLEDMLNAKTAAESLGISQEEHDRIVDELIYGKEPELVDDLSNKEKEPTSEDLEEAANDYAHDLLHDDVFESFIAGAQWQKEKDSIPAKDLEEVISYLSKRYPEVSFAKLSRIAVYVAKWQQEKEYTCYEEAFEDVAKWKKEQMMAKAIDAEVLENYDGKVIKYDDRILDEKLSDCKVFDKVKVIVIKGE